MKGILFYQTIICVINIAFGLFSLDQSLDEPSFDTFASMIALFNLLTSTFVYCYYAEGVTTDLLRVGNIFYSSLWYKLSSQEQKLLILLIQRSQIIFRLRGFEFFDCSLEVFAVVCSWMLIPKLVEIYFKIYFWLFLQMIRSAVSYFLIMKKLKWIERFGVVYMYLSIVFLI